MTFMVRSHCQTPKRTQITLEPIVVCVGVCVDVWQYERTMIGTIMLYRPGEGFVNSLKGTVECVLCFSSI